MTRTAMKPSPLRSPLTSPHNRRIVCPKAFGLATGAPRPGPPPNPPGRCWSGGGADAVELSVRDALDICIQLLPNLRLVNLLVHFTVLQQRLVRSRAHDLANIQYHNLVCIHD